LFFSGLFQGGLFMNAAIAQSALMRNQSDIAVIVDPGANK
jgi:hypothetical protein